MLTLNKRNLNSNLRNIPSIFLHLIIFNSQHFFWFFLYISFYYFLWFRTKRQTNSWFLAPNTKWCGKGRSADQYKELGASKGDVCCRKHDHCRMFVPAFQSKFGLFNHSPFTLSHCRCDRRQVFSQSIDDNFSHFNCHSSILLLRPVCVSVNYCPLDNSTQKLIDFDLIWI